MRQKEDVPSLSCVCQAFGQDRREEKLTYLGFNFPSTTGAGIVMSSYLEKGKPELQYVILCYTGYFLVIRMSMGESFQLKYNPIFIQRMVALKNLRPGIEHCIPGRT